MRLNFDKSEWEFDLTDGDVSLISTGNGVTVTLVVGDYTGTDTAFVNHHSGNSSSDHSSHEPSCKVQGPSSDSSTPGHGKKSSISKLAVKTPNNVIMKKSAALNNIKHPTTIFVDSRNGEVAGVDTSGATCIRCGDVVSGNRGGAFTIMEIRGRPGDTLSRRCGVYNASCSILPPGY